MEVLGALNGFIEFLAGIIPGLLLRGQLVEVDLRSTNPVVITNQTARRQLDYKVATAGGVVTVADRWYPSSKLCSACGVKNEALTLSERTWMCLSCGTSHDRDINAATNLAGYPGGMSATAAQGGAQGGRYPESSPGSACGAEGADDEDSPVVKPAA